MQKRILTIIVLFALVLTMGGGIFSSALTVSAASEEKQYSNVLAALTVRAEENIPPPIVRTRANRTIIVKIRFCIVSYFSMPYTNTVASFGVEITTWVAPAGILSFKW